MTGVERLEQYINDVIASPSKYPEAILLACNRFIADLDREDIYFDAAAAENAIINVEMLPHTKDRWQGRPTLLESWQCFWVGNLFGWKWKATNFRRFKYAFVLVPRKNGKTHISLCIALVMFGPDGELGAEVFLGATSEGHCKQILYKPIKFIVNNCPEYKDAFGVEVGSAALSIPSTNGTLKTVIRKPSDGDSPHCAIIDEYHEHETAEQWDTFSTGMGSRRQPLLHAISTAGSDLSGPCKNQYDECKRILRGEISGDSTFVLIYELDEDDDWQDPASLDKANPNIGISTSREGLLDQLEIAKRSTEKQNSYRTKHLNQWVGAKVAWMNMLSWQRQKKTGINIKQFPGQPCHIGVDLASKRDVTAIYVMFKQDNGFVGFPFFYVPESALEENDRYRKFVASGEMEATEGNMTDYSFVEEKIKEIAKYVDVQSIAFDPYQASYIITRLQAEGLPVIEYGQNVKNMSAPMKEVDALISDRRFWHDGNQCMTWMVSNVTGRIDVKENIYPNKANKNDKHCKIDGAVAMIMAMGRWLYDEQKEAHAYTNRGLRTL